MKNPASILVIVDKPKHAQVALERGIALAEASGAHLHLASFCWLPMVNRSDVFDTHQRRAIRRSAVRERRRWLDSLILDRGLSSADLDSEVVWTNDIAGWVEENAAAGGHDLVVKSVHHSESLIHTPLDWSLLRRCPVPVLLGCTREGKRSGRVLATVDLASTDARHRRLNRKVLDAAGRLSELLGAKLHCVNVVEIDGSFEDLEFFDERKMEKKARESARERLREMLADLESRAGTSPGAVKITRNRIHLPRGKVGQAVAGVATEIDADLVVVGTGARRGLSAMLLGGSAEKILTRAPCDVLAVHV